LLNDTYELCELVDSRDTHQLYSARDTRNDRVVHIALLRPEVALRKGVAQQFVRAPKVLTQLEHPNVGRVWSVESDATGIPFVVAEPRSGQSLATMLETFPEGMPLGVAVNLLVPVVEAMAAAHGSGLGHGAFDAKHVVLTEQAGTTTPKVFGFGATDAPANPSEDVRAIGALMYRALSGQSANDKRRQPLDELAPHLPLELTELVERCLASADERPADARLLSDELSSLRQRIGGQRASAVSVERAVLRDSPAPAKPALKPAPSAAKLAEAADQRRERKEARARRIAIERAPTAPIEEAPVEAKIDPHGATCFDAEPPRHEPEPDSIVIPPIAAAERDSIEFPMASLRPDTQAAAKPQPSPNQIETKADEPQQTREDRGKGKPRKPDGKQKPNEPGIAVAGPARLAAAFAPLEGGGGIVQGETKEAELVRAFRQSQEEEREKREARFGRAMPMSAAAATAAAAPKPGAGQAKAAPLLAGAKGAAADKKRDPARPTAAEVIALGQLHAQEEANKERRSRFVGALILLLFCFFLARAVPLLNGTRAHVEEVLGTHVKTAAIAFSALSLVMLIKTWALQIQSKELLLKPVTYTLKVVVICSVALCGTYLLPEGALGMVEGVARRFLPWSAAAYFMFLGFYGIMRGMRETQANLIAGLAMTLAYGGSFVGSYMIASNVIAPNMRAGKAQAEVAMQLLEQQQEGGEVDPDALVEGAGLDPEIAADIAKQAAAEDGFKETKIMGGNEEDDMKSIREMGDARKRNSERLDDLKDNLPEMAK
jgi:hypothetical protein